MIKQITYLVLKKLNKMNKIILYIATSSDGYIADIHGGVDWLPQPKNSEELEMVGYNQLMNRIDTIVMGSKSFEQIISFGEWGWLNKHTYVFTNKLLKSELTCVEFTNLSPSAFTEKFKQNQTNKDIWLLGGACLVQSFAKDNLIDEIVLTIVPHTLGNGIPLGLFFESFYLHAEKNLANEMIQKTYLKKKL